MSTSINFTVSDSLKEKLSLMTKIYLQNKNSDAFPQAVKMDEKGMLHSINSLVSISYKLGVEELGLTPELPEKAFLLPDTVVKLLLALSTGTQVNISVNGNNISVKTLKKKAAANFAAMNESAFPRIEAIDKSQLSITQISSSFIEKSIRACQFAISDNPSTPIHTCLHFIASGNKLTAFSCDGYSSAINTCEFNGEASFEISIPKNAISLLLQCLKTASEDISLGVTNDKRKAIFIIDSNTILRSSLISGTLLDYNKLFNNESNYLITINSSELLSALKKISIIHSEKTFDPKAIFEILDDNLSINYESKTSQYSDVINILELKCKDKESKLRIALNVNFLSDAIQSVNSEKVIFCFQSSLQPVKIIGTESNTPQTIVVPMRIV